MNSTSCWVPAPRDERSFTLWRYLHSQLPSLAKRATGLPRQGPAIRRTAEMSYETRANAGRRAGRTIRTMATRSGDDVWAEIQAKYRQLAATREPILRW